jgi:hypothetical protein
MVEHQYSLFRDLDRRCVSGGLNELDCKETVRKKRSLIESELNQRNPVAREVLDGRTTFVGIYDSFSHAFRGFRRFVPLRHDVAWNERLENFGKIVPNVRHFARRSIFAADNPIACMLYGLVASFAIGLVWKINEHSDAVPGDPRDGSLQIWLTAACMIIGLVVGLYAMIKYRTRDANHIHAREAAAYMDLNYECFHAFDDGAWARFIVLKSENRLDPMARPCASVLKESGPAASTSTTV